MAYYISEECVGCGSCTSECPAEAIALDSENGRCRIDTTACLECGSCVATCPAQAIKES